MFERATPAVRSAIAEAEHLARRRGDDHVGTGHLLVGLLRAEPTVRARIAARGVTDQRVELELARLVPRPEPPGVPRGHVALTAAVRDALERALTDHGTRRHLTANDLLAALLAEPDGLPTVLLGRLATPPRPPAT